MEGIGGFDKHKEILLIKGTAPYPGQGYLPNSVEVYRTKMSLV